MKKLSFTLSAVTVTLLISGCETMMKAPEKAPVVPAAIAVPAGNKMTLLTVGKGELTYECRAKADMKDAFEWVLAGPEAILYGSNNYAIGTYYKGPTWESKDGSKVTGKQVAVSPNPGAIALQLVKANPSTGSGVMTDVTYIQRLNTVAGLPPTAPCAANSLGAKQKVGYQADYVFYKAM